MLNRIEEIRKCLENNLAEAALALTLTLPDICGLVEEPNTDFVGTRYVNWITSNIPLDAFNINYDGAITALNTGKNPKFSELTPEAIYKLRCHFLHSGDADIQKENVVDNMDYFVLKKIGSGDFTDENGIGVTSGFACYIERDKDGNVTKHYEIDTGYFCNIIVDAAEKYYNNHPDKNAFNDHTVSFV